MSSPRGGSLEGAGAPTRGGSTLGCPHAERCPGCPHAARPHAESLLLKAARLETALARHPELERLPPRAGVTAASTLYEYRLRTKLVADASGRLGLFAAGSHDVVDIPGCRVQAPELFDAAAAIRALAPLEVPLRGVDLRLCDRGVLVCLVVEKRPDRATLERVRQRLLERVPRVVGLAVNVARPGSVQLLGPELELLAGEASERHHLTPDAPWHLASHGAFTQVHAGQTGHLHERIEASLAVGLGGLTGRRLLELYAGSGALALRLAARGANVTAVEAFAPAVERIALAAAEQALAVDAIAGDAEVFLRDRGAANGNPAFDAVLVNPPRRGLVPAVRTAIAALAPHRISYLSCEPETLARDLVHFRLLGYGAESIEAFDMIPWSDAVESLVVLGPKEPPPPRVLFEDESSVALFKLPFEPTTPQGESASSLLERARRGLGEPELTPVHRLDVGTSGVCWFARRPEHVASLARALDEGEKTYLALARGVTRDKGRIARPLLDSGTQRAAVTRYRRKALVAGHSLLELRPDHSRKHQLRRHLAWIGHPILGDGRYGDGPSNRHFEHRYGLDRPFLHCASLRVNVGGSALEIQAPLAGDLAAVLDGAARARAAADR
jgi:23S rRNA (uracil1939-C5)-methyltransferase